jgi:hypothetical protein
LGTGYFGDELGFGARNVDAGEGEFEVVMSFPGRDYVIGGFLKGFHFTVLSAVGPDVRV